jgi:hypothetical protein
MSCKKDTRIGSLEKSLITNMLLASRTEPDASPDPNSVVGLPNLEAQGPPPANAGVVHRLLAAREFLGRVRTVERPSGISDRLSGGEPARGIAAAFQHYSRVLRTALRAQSRASASDDSRDKRVAR